jgi:hypothetical protein
MEKIFLFFLEVMWMQQLITFQPNFIWKFSKISFNIRVVRQRKSKQKVASDKPCCSGKQIPISCIF